MEEHSHPHHGHVHGHVHRLESVNGIFVVAIVLNALFVCVEAGVGFWSNSLGLLSDAGHNLGDVFSLVLSLVAFRLAKLHSNKRFTYGYKKSTVLISLLNAIILLVAVGAIMVESIHKFTHPQPVDGVAVSWTAGAGIVVNGLTAWLLMKDQKEDLNIRGAFLHMLADTLVSVGVVVSGIVIAFTGISLIDPIVSLVIAVVILASTWRLLSESLRLSLDAVPEKIDVDKVDALLSGCDHVVNVHHVHVWAISTTDVALTAHVVIDDVSAMDATRKALKQHLKEMGICHSTLEMETPETHCRNQSCG